MGKHEVARPAVFLDRDGVINRVTVRNGTPHPPCDAEEFELYEDVPDGCARLKAANFLLVVITNQPDVGRGTQSREAVEAMNLKMQSALPLLDRIEICYHAGERYGQPCECRKPRPGLILRAAAELNIDPRRSYVIGGPQVVARSLSNAVTKKPCAKRLILRSQILTMPWAPFSVTRVSENCLHLAVAV